MSNKQTPTKGVPNEVDEQIRFDNRLPHELTGEVFAFVRGLIEPMSDEEFFALRVFWQQSFDFFKALYDTTPEIESAFQFFGLCLSATNHRARGIAPLPDLSHPTVSALKAENEALKARVAELEGMAKSSSERSLLDEIRGKVVWDKDRFPDHIERVVDIDHIAETQKQSEADIKMSSYLGSTRGFYELPKQPSDFTQKLHAHLLAELQGKVDQLERQLGAVTIEAQFHAEKAFSADWLTFTHYQHQARDTAVYKRTIFEGLSLVDDGGDLSRLLKLSYTVLGLAGEVGEFANIVKKIERDGKSISEMLSMLVDELGDVFWYAFACADEIGVPAEDIARANLAKLAKRKQADAIHDNNNRKP